MNSLEALRAEIQLLRQRNQALARELRITREKDRHLMRLTDRFYRRFDEGIDFSDASGGAPFDGISFVVVAYNIPRHLRRTLTSLSPSFQGIAPEHLEVIVIDNGSSPALRKEDFQEFPQVAKVIRVDGHPSPVSGLNQGIEAAKFSTIALMIDGAHILSPGVARNTKSIVQSVPRPVINVPQYTLGPASQNLRSVENAFEVEEEALRELGWPANGYALFDYAVIPGEVVNKHTLDAIETNCLITTREVLADCGGYDERFDEAGGGLANIEIFHRLTHDESNQYISFPGEGSFHQDHGGTTTALTSEQRDKLVAEYYEKYREVTGDDKNFSLRPTMVFGEVSNCNRTVPTISTEYGQARQSILRQLADIYISRVQQNVQGPMPSLTLKATHADERKIRPILSPVGLPRDDERLGYRKLMQKLHKAIKPAAYFEIGVDDGGSISLADCPAVGIDPDFELVHPLRRPTRIFRQPSDTFFANDSLTEHVFSMNFELAFIDGMHLSEFVLRDFMNVEKRVSKGCVVVVDDVLPEQYVMAQRERQFNAWCGDVYKLIFVLQELRPDLHIHVVPAMAGPYRKGIAVISNLDPANDTLWTQYDAIESRLKADDYHVESIDALESRMPICSLEQFDELLGYLEERSAS